MTSWSPLAISDAKERLRLWDAGEIVWSVEMGGLGPGYEQAIQVLAIEIIRDNVDGSEPIDTQYSNWGDSTVSRVDYKLPNGKYACGGFSGAQVGAAKAIAYRLLKDGETKALDSVPSDRKIQVSNFWPKVAAV